MLTASTRLCVYFLPNATAHIHATTCSLTERTSRSILPSLGWVVEERICSLKSVHWFDCSVRNAFSDAQRVYGFANEVQDKGTCWLWNIYFTLFFILLFSFSLAVSVCPNLLCRCLLGGCECVCVVGECGQGWVSENVLVDLSQASRGLGESAFFVLCWWKAALDPIYLSLTSGHFTSSQFTVIILNQAQITPVALIKL